MDIVDGAYLVLSYCSLFFSLSVYRSPVDCGRVSLANRSFLFVISILETLVQEYTLIVLTIVRLSYLFLVVTKCRCPM